MKKTLFLSYFLVALLACSSPLEGRDTITLTDANPNWDVKEKDWYYSYTDVRTKDMYACYPLEVYAANAHVEGGWSSYIHIYSGAKLYAQLVLQKTDNPQDSELWNLLYDRGDEIYRLHITMEDKSSLQIGWGDLYLGSLIFNNNPTVNITLSSGYFLEARPVGKHTERDFTINATINLSTSSSLKIWNQYTSSLKLECSQHMNLIVDRSEYANSDYRTDEVYAPYVDSSGVVRLPYAQYRSQLNGETFYAEGTSEIRGYLRGSSTISLGNADAIEGMYHGIGEGITQVSWLLNNVEVRPYSRAEMRNGYYGGTITMGEGSSLRFNMDVIPAGVDNAKMEGGAAVIMAGGNKLDLALQTPKLDLTVNGLGNTLVNGALLGNLTLGAGSELTSEGALGDWWGPTSIKMGARSKLVMSMDKSRWYNDISKLQVLGDGVRIENAYLRIHPETNGGVYTLGNGVEKLVYHENTFFCIDDGTLDLAGNTANLNIKVWAAFRHDNVIRNGTINTDVEIDPTSALALQNVTIGNNAFFSLGADTRLDLGGQAIPLERISVAAGATATVSNFSGPLRVADKSIHTLKYDDKGTPSVLKGNNTWLRLEGGAAISAGIDSTILISQGSEAINLNVTTDGLFTLGQVGQIVRGRVAITYNGPGDILGKLDVNSLYQLIGSLDIKAQKGRVYAGIIGQQEHGVKDTTSTGYVSAKQISVGGFIGESLELYAVNNTALVQESGQDANAITLKGNGIAAEFLRFTATENGCGNIDFQSNLSAKRITLEGNNIKGGGYECAVEFTECCTIQAQGGIKIDAGFKGGDLTAVATTDISLGTMGLNGRVEKAAITSQNGTITMGAFTGGSLKADAKGALTINGSVSASGNAEITGGSVGMGTLTANTACITSTAGDISLGGALSAKGTSTLDSAQNISVQGDVLEGSLAATAGGFITLGNIGTAEIAVGNAELTATNGAITASSFNGASLKASAKGAVTINGGVKASGNAEITGGSVGIGTLTANTACITSTAGDIKLGGALSAKGTSTLDSAQNISVQGDVLEGSLAATAGGSITLGNIGTSEIAVGNAELTANGEKGAITASSFNGASLKATAKGAVTINGSVAASTGNAVLTGTSVSIRGALASNAGTAYIESTAGDISVDGALTASNASITSIGGNIKMGGNFSTGTFSVLNSAGKITIGGNVTGGDLTATAAQSISLKAIAIDDKTAVLTAGSDEVSGDMSGDIMADSFTGGVLKTNATGAVTINGSVEASHGINLRGASVSAGGSLTARQSNDFITSTGGNISIGGNLSAAGSNVLDSAGSITIGTLNDKGEITLGGNVTCGALTATAADSIKVGNIGSAGQVERSAELTATNGSITAGNITAGLLTVSAKGEVQLGAVVAGQEGAGIASTGGSVKLKSFNGQGAQISALNGSIQVASAVSGSGHTFLAGDSVTFNGSTDLQSATVRAPKVTWATGATAAGLNLTGAAETDDAAVAVGGALVLKDSRVQGDVTINGEKAKVTVDRSAITGTEQGATDIELNGGTIGNVILEEYEKLVSFAASGTSGINGLTSDLMVVDGILNGGELTLAPEDKEKDYGLVPDKLTVNQTTKLNGNLYLQYTPTLNLSLKKANTDTPLLSIDGNLECIEIVCLAINLAGDESVEGGERYALISLNDAPETWPDSDFLIVDGLGAKTEELEWVDGTLYYQNGTELKTATWTPGDNHKWNTTDKNWTQDDHAYRYKDGVDVVFNDAGQGGEVELEGELAPKDVLVEGGRDYTFKGTGRLTGETSLTKQGNGTLTIENANNYSGGTFIKAGTLVMADPRALGTGTVTLAGGTLELVNGPKDFDLTVTGQNNRLVGNVVDAFTGSLTLEENSHLLSSGSMASWNGPREIAMKNGSTLEMDLGRDIWINDITNLTVEGVATMVNAYLRINPNTNGGVYTLDNGVQNLKGEGVTAYCLDGSTFNLNGHTTNLGIIVWNAQPNKDNTVMRGVVDTKVDIRQGSRLILEDVEIGANVTFLMGDGAYLDMGGSFTKRARLDAFSFTGASATVDNGTLMVGDGETLKLGTSLYGTAAVSLGAGATLDLDRHTLEHAVTPAADATIGNGTLNGNMKVGTQKTLTLCGNLNGSGDISLGAGATLELAGHELDNTVTLEGSATLGGGGTYNGALSVRDGKTLSLGSDLSGTGDISLGNASTLELGGHVLYNTVTLTGTATIGSGTIAGALILADGVSYTWSTEGLQLNGGVILEANSSLNLNNKSIVTASIGGSGAGITNGSVTGNFTLANGASFTWAGETLQLTGNTILEADSHFDLNNRSLASATVTGSGAGITNGSISGNLTLADGASYIWTDSGLQIAGSIVLDNGATLDLGSCTTASRVVLAGRQTSLGNGTLNSAFTVGAGNTLTLCGDLDGTGAITLESGATLNPGNYKLGKEVILGGSASVAGTINGPIYVAAGKTLTLGGNLNGTGYITMANTATLDLGTHVLDKAVALEGSATLGNGTYNGALHVGQGYTLTLNGDLSGSGGITLAENATLNLGTHYLSKDVALEGSATIGGGRSNGAISVGGGNTLTLNGDLSGFGRIYLGSGAALDLGTHTLDKSVDLEGSATIGNGTYNGDLYLKADQKLSLSGDLSSGTGSRIYLGSGAELDLGTHKLDKNVALSGSATIGNGTHNGELEVAENLTLTLGGDLSGTGVILLSQNVSDPASRPSLDLGGHVLSKSVALWMATGVGSAAIGNGTFDGELTVSANQTLELTGELSGSGHITLTNGAKLDLGGRNHSVNVVVNGGEVSIGNGTLSSSLVLEQDAAFTWSEDDLKLNGGATLGMNSHLNLDGNTIGSVTVNAGAGKVIIEDGTIDGNLFLGDSTELDLVDPDGWFLDTDYDLELKGRVTMGSNAFLRLADNSFDIDVTVNGHGSDITDGTIEGNLTLADGADFSWDTYDLEVEGDVILGANTWLNLNDGNIDKATVAGSAATITRGTIDKHLTLAEGVSFTWTDSLQLEGSATLEDGAELNLGSCTHTGDVTLKGSASIGNGTFNSALAVDGGRTLTLCGDLSGTENITLAENAKLDLGGYKLDKGVTLKNSATIGNGALNSTLAVGGGETLTLCGDLSGTGTVTLKDGATLNLNKHTLDNAVALEGSATIGGGAFNSDLTVYGGNKLTLDGNLTGGGNISLASGATLELAGHTLGNTVTLNGYATIGSGTIAGDLTLAESVYYTWPNGGLEIKGRVVLKNNAELSLGNQAVSNQIILDGNRTYIGNGTLNSELSVDPGKTLILNGDLSGTGTVTLGDNAALDLCGRRLDMAVTLEGSATIGRGTLGSTLTVGTDKTLTLSSYFNGAVTLDGGTIKLADGRKGFNLTVTGKGNRMEGDGDNAFIGSLTLEEGSTLYSDSAMASWDGPGEMVMKNGSTLVMATGPGKDIWINDISKLRVEGDATMVDTFLRINPYTNSGVYTLGNGVQNLKGEGVTAYCLDGSTFDLNNHTTNLGIIVWNAQPNKDNTIMNGRIDTKVDIHDNCNLFVNDASIGSKATILLGAGANLVLNNVGIETDATFSMGDGAYLDMGSNALRTTAVPQGAFTFTGNSAKIDNGTLLVESGGQMQLGTNLEGSATISLGDNATLNLDNHSLANTVVLDGGSASIGNGTLNSDVAVASGKTLRLGGSLNVAGKLSGSGTIVKENGDTASVTGGLEGFTGSVEVQAGVLNLMNASSLEVQDVTLGAGSTLGVFKGGDSTPETAYEGTLTIRDAKALTAGKNATLNANLVMESGSTLDVSATEGQGLRLGSSLTLMQDISLSSLDLENVYGLTQGASYNLFSGVDALTMNDKTYTEPFTPDVRIDAVGWFRGVDAEHIYVTYDGSNVGLYCMVPMPEPTTSTLSLLALAALAARRRKD